MPNERVISQQSLPLREGATLPPQPQPTTATNEGAQYLPNTQPSAVGRFRQGLRNIGSGIRNSFYNAGTRIGNFADRFSNPFRARKEGNLAKADRYNQLREARANRERIFRERAEERRAQGPSLIGSLAGAGIRGLHGLWTGAKNFWNDSIYDQLPEAAQNLSDFAGSAIDAGVQGARVGGMALGALGRGVNSFMNWASDKRNARVYGREQRDLARERFEQERQDYLANREANRATNPIFQRVQHTGRPEVPELPEAYTSGRLNLSSAMREEARLANERQQAEAQGLERVPEYIPGVGQDFNRGLQIVGRGVKGVYNNTIGAIGRWLGGGRQEGPRQAEVQPQTAPVPVREPNIPQVQEQPATAPVQPSTQPLVQQQPQTYTNPLNTPQPSFARTSADYLDPTDQTDDRNWAGFKVM